MPYKLIKGKSGMSVVGPLVGVLVAVLLITILVPLIRNSVAGATNLTGAEIAILGIMVTLVIIGVLVAVVKKSGLHL